MKNKKKKIILLVVLSVILIFLIGIASYFTYININGESKYLKIELNGKEEVTINYKEEYEDLGAKASYKNKDITKDIVTSNNLDLEHVGTYTYTYKIKYKKHSKEIKRTVKVVDLERPEITLNGEKEITIYVGSNYEEKGATALDNYDLDLTEKIEISGNVDTSKVGEYTITYKVNDSSGNEASIERLVKVIEKPKETYSSSGPKVAVLNYHFFYETDEENTNLCGRQSICLKMDRFREQLKWLNDNGYTTLTMKQFVSWMYGEIDVPEKSVLITIDDGALGTGSHNGNYLIPALEEYKIHATLFLITGWWDISNYQSPYLEVESHTHDLHVSGDCGRSKVNCISHDELLADLNKSIEVTKSKEAFCFPFYDYTNNSINTVKEAGFKVAFIGGNRKASRSDDKYKIPRYVIYDSTSLQSFINMVR